MSRETLKYNKNEKEKEAETGRRFRWNAAIFSCWLINFHEVRLLTKKVTFLKRTSNITRPKEWEGDEELRILFAGPAGGSKRKRKKRSQRETSWLKAAEILVNRIIFLLLMVSPSSRFFPQPPAAAAARAPPPSRDRGKRKKGKESNGKGRKGSLDWVSPRLGSPDKGNSPDEGTIVIGRGSRTHCCQIFWLPVLLNFYHLLLLFSLLFSLFIPPRLSVFLGFAALVVYFLYITHSSSVQISSLRTSALLLFYLFSTSSSFLSLISLLLQCFSLLNLSNLFLRRSMLINKHF